MGLKKPWPVDGIQIYDNSKNKF
ncbi:uncharacterized protein METZ01_LOCUS316392 [marine metagenome]|uniref:Uncharacterized protein n=1 Tax=marine metagenome TaxID=408172 RepID=A0A382NSS6_9ZZZZ